MDFGKRLRAIRMNRGVTQQQTADTVGVSLRVYQNYEQGTRRPTFECLALLCRLFDVSSDYLLGLSDEERAGER